MKTYPVSEIFGPTIQGEGTLIGVPTMFVRFAGCDFDHCLWCDTLYAVNPKQVGWRKTMMTATEIGNHLDELNATRGVQMVTLSGGNPALFADVDLLYFLHYASAYTLAMETQQWPESSPIELAYGLLIDHLVISPKPPSSGMTNRFDVESLRRIISHRSPKTPTTVKIVVFDRVDFEWAVNVFKSIGDLPARWVISVGTLRLEDLAGEDDLNAVILNQYANVAAWVLHEPILGRSTFQLLPQLHTLVWGRKRGV